MISRVLGFVRDVMLASILGAGMVADCFVMAFKFPNFFRRMFAEGAFNAAFVPIFSSIIENDGLTEVERREHARQFAEEAMAFLFYTLLIFLVVTEVFMPWLLMGPALGFLNDQPKYDLAVLLTRLTFPYLMFISLVSLLGGVLNAIGKFAAVAFTPVLLNGVMITALYIGSHYTNVPAHVLSVGVTVAGIVQFLWLVGALKRYKMSISLKRPRLTPGIKRLLKLILPAAVGAGAFQINLLIDVFLAGFLKDGSLSFLYYADRINQLPVGVVGVAVGTALLPLLSRQVAAGNSEGAMNSQNRAIEMVLYLTIPAAVAIIALSQPMIRVLYERNAFTPATTLATAAALSAFAVGLPAYVLVKVLGPGFYARHDTATPVRYAMVSMGVNFLLNVALIFPLQHVGIALATALAAWLNVGQLTYGLIKRSYFKADDRLKKRTVAVIISSAVMGFTVWYGARLLDGPLHGNAGAKVSTLMGLIVLGMGIYGVMSLITGALTLGELKKLNRFKAKA
jgi:putative peptidoglycan lipid II flippase